MDVPIRIFKPPTPLIHECDRLLSAKFSMLEVQRVSFLNPYYSKTGHCFKFTVQKMRKQIVVEGK